MNKQELLEFHTAFCSRMLDTVKAKNADYTGASQSPFANFTTVETIGLCPTETGFLTRITDKLARLAALVGKGHAAAVKDEAVEDTLMDMANYCVLLAAYLKSKTQLPLNARKLCIDSGDITYSNKTPLINYNSPPLINYTDPGNAAHKRCP